MTDIYAQAVPSVIGGRLNKMSNNQLSIEKNFA